MPSANGVYSLPPGYLAVTGQTIVASTHNLPLEDIAAALTLRLSRDGSAPMTGPLLLTDGLVGAPSLAFASGAATGLFKTTAGYAVTINGTQVAEFGSVGLLSGVVTGSIADQAVTLPKIAAPGAPSLLLGSNANAALTVTGATNNGSGLIRLTVASTSTFATGQTKTVAGVVGTIEANGSWTITVVDATDIDLQGSTFVNAYTSGGTIGGGWDRISLGAGLTMGGTAGNVLSATPVGMSGAQGLAITNDGTTPNSWVDIAAKQAILTAPGGGAVYVTGVNCVVNTNTVGVANGLDAGSRAASTWYNLFLISNGSSVAGLASLSATAPTLPTGYTYFVRVGAMLTDTSGNFYRTKQLGNKTQYLATAGSNTTIPPVMASGAAGSAGGVSSTLVSVGVAGFVPPTATAISVLAGGFWKQNGVTPGSTVFVAPSASYSGANNGPVGPNGFNYPIAFQPAGGSLVVLNTQATMVLESSNIYWASSAVGGVIACLGWADDVNAT